MIGSREASLLAALLLSACATSYVVPRPSTPESVGLAIAVKVNPPIGFFGTAPNTVYFVRLDGAESLERGTVIASTMEIGGLAYLLNVPAGEYAAVASTEAKEIQTAQPPPGGVSIGLARTSHYSTFYSREIVESTRVTVQPGRFAFIGRLVVDTSVGLSSADPTQLHYISLLAPGAATSTFGQIASVGNYQYAGGLGEIQRDAGTLNELRTRAAKDLAGGGWSEILGAAAAAP